jgi:GT2 family glycosyltransferase
MAIKKFSQTYNPNLFLYHNIADDKNITFVPDICVVLLSCKRQELLKRTLTAFIKYMYQVEPTITYEFLLWDNGGSTSDLDLLLYEFPIDKLIISRQNMGIAFALNNLFFSACRSPYILSLEEDWEAKYEKWPKNFPALSMSQKILDSDSTVLEVWLRDFDLNFPDHTKNRSSWMLTPKYDEFILRAKHGQIQYRRQFSGDIWGAYTNGASLKDRKKLEKIGKFKGVNGESNFALRVKEAGYASAHLCPNQVKHCEESEIVSAILFQHIGTSGRSSGHKKFGDLE